MRHWCVTALATTLLAAAPATKEVTFKTPDGFTLKGTLTLPEGKGRKPLVILSHQFMADRKGWEPLVAELHARGLATLAMDVRGHGESTDKAGTAVKVEGKFMEDAKRVGFAHIPDDLAQVVAWARKQKDIQPRRIALAGSSVSGFSVLMAAGKVQPVAVLSLSPAGSPIWGDQARAQLAEAVKKAACAVFLLSSEDDGDAAENLKALKGLGGVHAQLLPGKEHGFDYLAARKDTMAVFLAEYLLRAPMHAPAGEPKAKAEAPKAEETPTKVE